MLTSGDDARLLFARWQSETPPLRIKLMSNSLIFEATGTVTGFSLATLQLGGPGWQFTIPMDKASFVFSDPREIPIAAIRDAETAKYEFGLAVEFPSGDRLALMELKRPGEDAAEAAD